MGMVPSYKTHQWKAYVRRPLTGERSPSGTGGGAIQIRVMEEDGEWRDYWVPEDEANTDYVQYLEWLSHGNEPQIIF